MQVVTACFSKSEAAPKSPNQLHRPKPKKFVLTASNMRAGFSLNIIQRILMPDLFDLENQIDFGHAVLDM